jgi:hypothetical protein
MSFFDLDNDGYGVHLWDVGAAGDGLRGVEDAPGATNAAITAWRSNSLNPQGAAWNPNPYHRWSADQSEPENWSGNRLIGGGKHYGFLEFDVERLKNGEYRISFQNWHTFPINQGDTNFTVTGYELRQYSNRVVLEGPADDLRPVALPPACADIDLNQDARIDSADLGIVLSGWGTPAGDVNGDGTTDSADLGVLLSAAAAAASCQRSLWACPTLSAANRNRSKLSAHNAACSSREGTSSEKLDGAGAARRRRRPATDGADTAVGDDPCCGTPSAVRGVPAPPRASFWRSG